MTTLESDPDGSLWFFASKDSSLAGDIASGAPSRPRHADNGSADFVSVTGRARRVDDDAKAKELWNPALKAWFTDGLEDPKLALIEVQIESAGYWDAPDNRFVRLAGILQPPQRARNTTPARSATSTTSHVDNARARRLPSSA